MFFLNDGESGNGDNGLSVGEDIVLVYVEDV